jgi:signal transduction histidine kinase
VTHKILYLAKSNPGPDIPGVLSPTRFKVISVESIVAAHKYLQTNTVDCLVINNLGPIDAQFSELTSLVTVANPTPMILIDEDTSTELLASYPNCRVISSSHLDSLPDTIDRILEHRYIESAIEDHHDLQQTILEIIHRATKETSAKQIDAIVWEKLHQSELFDYVWLGTYDRTIPNISITHPIAGNFSVETVSDILHISDKTIFETAVQCNEIQTTTAPVKTRETAQVNNITTSPSYQLNCAVIPIQSVGQSSDILLLATHRSDAFDGPEKRLLTLLRDVAEYFTATNNQQSSGTGSAQEEIDTFVATLVHELRSPLGIAQAYLDIGRENDNNAEEQFEKVSDALRELDRTIDELASMTKNDLTIEIEEISLAPLVQEVWESIDTSDGSIQIESAVELTADRVLLKILFRNLLSNAVQHGGENSTIHVGAVPNGFFIEDNGRGIPDEIKDEIFDRGFSNSGGLGVGLSVVDDIVTAHEWEINIESEVDEGTRVEITNVTMVDRGGED